MSPEPGPDRADPDSLRRSGYLGAFGEEPGYLNFASYGPPSHAVAQTAADLMAVAARGAVGASDVVHSEDARARAAFARLSGFGVDSVALVPHTSLGLFQVAFGVGGTVLVSRGEFPANLYPWLRSREARLTDARLFGAVGEAVTPDAVAAALDEARAAGVDVTALAVSAVDFRTGFRADLPALREAIGPDRLLIVDGIQAFGVVDLPWTLADALVVGGQKWLRAGWGAGALAFSPAGLGRIRPILGGWTGVVDPSRYDGEEHPVRADAQRFGISNLSPFATGSFATALELVESAGIGAIETAIARRVDALLAALDAAGVEVLSPRRSADRAGIVAVGFGDHDGAPAASPGRAAEAHAALAAAGFTATLHGNDRIRLAVHATTSPSVFDAVATILKDHS